MHPQLTTQVPFPLETEEWRPVIGWESWYEVSNVGTVRRIKAGGHGTHPGLILKPSLDGRGYPQVTLCRDGRRSPLNIHRLVAGAFLGPCPANHEVNHENGIKTDNRPANLEWVTPLQNKRHAALMGLVPSGERHANSKLTDDDIGEIRKIGRRASQIELARRFGVSQSVISAVLRREAWRPVLS